MTAAAALKACEMIDRTRSDLTALLDGATQPERDLIDAVDELLRRMFASYAREHAAARDRESR